jgi:elongation factor G
MPVPAPRPIRNIGILAHIDAGKTSLTERILYVSGRLRLAGDIDEGTTATDYLDVERERGITVKAAAAHLEWRRGASPNEASPNAAPPAGRDEGALRINLIDTPGHVDFSSEVDRSLRALDGAVVLLCAVAGVQSRTETLFRACVRRGAARLAFVNKMDRKGASFRRAFDDLARILDPNAVAIHLPWGEGESFRGIVDLVEMKAYDFGAGAGASASARPEGGRDGAVPRPLARPVPPELERAAAEARSALVEALASRAGAAEGGSGADEGPAAACGPAAELLEDFVAGRESDPELLRAALRAATIAGRATPVLCGYAFADTAAALLLDAVADYLPAPEEAVMPEGRDPATGAPLKPAPGDPFSALVFKTVSDSSLGRLSWARLWSGSASAGDKVLDARTGRSPRISRIFRIQADKLEAVERAEAGDIVALAFGGQAQMAGGTGSTLCDPRRPVLYEAISFDEPVVSLAVEPRTRADGERLRSGAAALVEDDPSIRVREDPLTGRVELSGMGELHLEVAVDRLEREYGARIKAGKPQVSYREALAGEGRAVEDFDRDLGGERARASVSIRLAPGREGGGLSLSFDLPGKAAPSLVVAVRRGVEAALSVGPAAGFPLDGVEAVVDGLSLPGGLSSPGRIGERAAEIAASLAAGKAAAAAGSAVVEPVMRLELTVPEDFLGAAAAAVSGRGGRIESVDEAPGGGRAIVGAAPLRRLFGFATELRSATEGRAEYVARFLRYEPVPATAGAL